MTKILIVDDNTENLYILEVILKGNGFEVLTATNGSEALELAQRMPPGLIISDILMPVMDGFSLCRKWKEDEQLKHIPFIFYTATYTESKDEEFALNLGADRFILKPQEPETWIRILGEVFKEDCTGKTTLTKPLGEEMEFFRQHNEILFSKLEKKMLELEIANKNLKAKEEALQRNEEFLNNIIENIPNMIFVKEAETLRFVKFNKAGEELLGQNRQDLIGKNDYDFFPKSQADFFTEKDREVLKSMQLVDIPEEPVQTKKLGERILHTKKIPIIEREGKAHYLLGISEDITERKRAEQNLLESEEKYRSIFENTVEGIFQSTPEGRFLSVNPAVAKLFGYYSPQEFMERITDIGGKHYANPKDREIYKNILDREGIIKGFEIQLINKDGNHLWASINARVVKDDKGTVLSYEGTVEDITSRKLAEEQLKESLELLRKSLIGTIQAMSLIVETRDPYTAGHQRRVSSLARVIAQEMGLSQDTANIIRMAGVIHDIGKVAVPSEIMNKPTKLTDIEFSLIKVHSQSGYEILKDAQLPYPIAEIVLQHHEKLDGSGYPQGLKNGQILLESKIITVADVVEAMASHRPYRPALGIDVALEEIEKNKDILYDVGVVEVCVKLFREKRFSFE